MCTRKVKVTMAKRLARGSDNKENDPDLDDFKSSKKSKTVKCFGSPTRESRMAEITKGFVPFNTKKSTDWSTRVWHDWVSERNVTNEKKCPADLLENPKSSKLNYRLCRFVAEVRKKDGTA